MAAVDALAPYARRLRRPAKLNPADAHGSLVQTCRRAPGIVGK